jgi:gliding motility associated protien GldN
MKPLKSLVLILAGGVGSLTAQVDLEGLPTKNSTLKIPVYEQLYRVRVWRDMDLKEKQNKGFFARGNEISRVLVNAIKAGEISKVYEEDSLTDRSAMDKEKFLSKFQYREEVKYDPWDAAKDYFRDDIVTYNGKKFIAMDGSNNLPPDDARNSKTDYWQETSQGSAASFEPTDIYRVQIVEDIIFDRRRSRLYYDIIALRLQAWDEAGGGFKPLGWIKYSDAERVFRAHPEQAVWFNRQNTAQNRNFADAFLLRLFHATIYRVENPDNADLTDIYGSDKYHEAILAREWEEMKLMEKEHNLWEY